MKHAVKVLIVDDDKSSSQMLGEVVKRMGMKPIITNKPNDALNVVKLQIVHGALVDVLLPKMSGVDLVQEFRQTKFGDAPVVFVSGVFKDKAFASEAIRKTSAADFLFKPFGADDLMNSLKTAFSSLLNREKLTIQTLLTRKLNSTRERARAIENLDRIQGPDFPLVLSVLMEAGASGHLNIVNDQGDIFGATLARGTLASVDSTDSQSAGVLALIAKGYLRQDDWDEFQANGSKRFSLERLVLDGYVSPHGVAVVRHEQILADIRSICAGDSLQINFVPQEESEDPPKHAVRLHDLLGLLETSFGELFSESYLTEFYDKLKDSPVQLTHESREVTKIFESEQFRSLPKFKQLLINGAAISEIIAAFPEHVSIVHRCLHHLVLARTVTLDDIHRVRSVGAQRDRFKKIHEDLIQLTPDKVFEYFGGPERAVPSVVQSIYDEYCKSNHPDLFAKDSPADVQDLARKCFDIITKARDVMVDEVARAELFEQLKSASQQNRKKSNELTAQGFDLIKRGQFQKAQDVLNQAGELFATNHQYLLKTWAELRAGVYEGKPQLAALAKDVDKAISIDDRKSAFYFMVMGLIRKQMGDPSAITFFEKAIEADPQFTEARREINSTTKVKEKKVDILNGDLSVVVSSLFRRKSE